MNQWDNLTDIFGCTLDEGDIPECAADNICIAWPSIIKCINNNMEFTRNLKALDFGCGGGLFCRELHEIGFSTIGYDISEELVDIAKENTPQEVTICNSNAVMRQLGKYDLITSIMVLQFINDIESTIDNLVSLLSNNGLLVFVVFNPEFIEDNISNKVFTGFETYRTGYMELKEDVKVPVYNHTESDYRKLFESKGFEQVYIDYPVFTEEFLGKHEMPFSTKKSEYLIQAFKHKIT